MFVGAVAVNVMFAQDEMMQDLFILLMGYHYDSIQRCWNFWHKLGLFSVYDKIA